MRLFVHAGLGLCLVGAVWPSPQSSTDSDELLTRLYDERGLQSFVSGFPGSVAWLPIERAGFTFAGPEPSDFGPEFHSLFGDTFWEEMEFEGRTMGEYSDRQVLLRAPKDLHDAYVAMRERYASWVQPSVTLQIDVMSQVQKFLPDSSFLSAETVDAALANLNGAAKVKTYVIQVPVHSFGSLRDQSTRMVSATAEVEIAQGTATIQGPMHPYRFGSFGVFMAVPQANGIDLSMVWMTSDEPGIQPQPLLTQALLGEEGKQPGWVHLGGQIQLTSQAAQAVTATIHLADGQVWVTSFGSETPENRRAILVRRLGTSDVAAMKKGFEWNGKYQVRMKWFQEAQYSRRFFYPVSNQSDGDATEYVRYPIDDEVSSVEYSDSGSDILRALLDDADTEVVDLWEANGGVALRVRGPGGANINKGAAELDRLTRRLEALVVQRQNYSVRMTLHQGSGAETLLVQGVTQEGAPLAWIHGRERSEIQSFESEVAGSAAIQYPQVRLTCEGLIGQLSIDRVNAKRIRLESNGRFLQPLENTEIQFDSRMHGPFRTTSMSSTSLHAVQFLDEVAPGIWRTRLGATGDEGTSIGIEVRAL